VSIASMTAERLDRDERRQARRPEDDPRDTGLKQVTRYIPTEVVTLYVIWLGVLGPIEATRACEGNYAARWILAGVFLLLTPPLVYGEWWLQRRAKRRRGRTARDTLPIPEMVVSVVAFTAWVFALPSSPFADFCAYDPKFGTPTLVTVTAFFGFAAKAIGRALQEPQHPPSSRSPKSATSRATSLSALDRKG
jgi:hypothetical protein